MAFVYIGSRLVSVLCRIYLSQDFGHNVVRGSNNFGSNFYHKGNFGRLFACLTKMKSSIGLGWSPSGLLIAEFDTVATRTRHHMRCL